MATFTSYLNLEKPNTSETFNLLKMNANWEKIDNGVSALNSNIANIELDDLAYIKNFNSSDGWHYSRVITINSATRFPILILRISQLRAMSPIFCTVNNLANSNLLFFSDDTAATWDESTNTLTVDNGQNAWAAPMIIFPRGYLS